MAHGFIFNAMPLPITVTLNNGTATELAPIVLLPPGAPIPPPPPGDIIFGPAMVVAHEGGQATNVLGTSNDLYVGSVLYNGNNIRSPQYSIDIDQQEVSPMDDVGICVFLDGIKCFDAHNGETDGFTVKKYGGFQPAAALAAFFSLPPTTGDTAMANGYIFNATPLPITLILNNGTPMQLQPLNLHPTGAPAPTAGGNILANALIVLWAGGQTNGQLGTDNNLLVASTWYTGNGMTDPNYSINIDSQEVSIMDDVVIAVFTDGIKCYDAHTGKTDGFKVVKTGGYDGPAETS